MELYIVRHAIAVEREEFEVKTEFDDSQRPLTSEGQKKFKKVAAALKPLIKSVDLIISSTYLRAQQTTEILAQHFPNTKVVSSSALVPSAEPEEFARWCKQHLKKKTRSVIIVGHEPHLSSLASWILFGSSVSKIKLKKGGCLSLSIAGDLGPKSGNLNWALTPKCLGIRS